jgi:hypothetical protein
MTFRVERAPNKLYKIIKGDGRSLCRSDWTSKGLGAAALLNIAPSVQVEREIGTLWFSNKDEASEVRKQYEFEVG